MLDLVEQKTNENVGAGAGLYAPIEIGIWCAGLYAPIENGIGCTKMVSSNSCVPCFLVFFRINK